MRNGRIGNPMSECPLAAFRAGDVDAIAFDSGLADATA